MSVSQNLFDEIVAYVANTQWLRVTVLFKFRNIDFFLLYHRDILLQLLLKKINIV